MPRLEADRGANLRVLYIDALLPSPDQDSGSVRAVRTFAAMRALGWKVAFAAGRLRAPEPDATRLRQAGVEVFARPWTDSIESLLRERGDEFDVVIIARYYVAGPLIGMVRRHAKRALLVFDTLDLHYVRNRRLAQLKGSPAMAVSAEAIYREELECVRASDVTWVVSDVERDTLLREVPGATVLVQSNVHDAVGGGKPFAAREGLLFVGGFGHPPNVDAVTWFVDDIVPRLREQLPGVQVYVIGSNMPRVVEMLARDGVQVLGFVPDLEPWLDHCRISVSPLRYGAGVKGKVNQAMAHGLPVVATRISVEGMNVIEGEEVLVQDEPDAFAEAVVRLYRDEALWNRISRGGLENIRRHFSTEVATRALQALPGLVARRVT
jgi:glycosyltransferase involved in cell wall biosynthesis